MDEGKKTTFTYELTNDQQELLLGVMLTGNYRRREVPYSLWSIEGDRFNATLYQKEKHGRRKLCIQGSGAEDFVLFVLEPRVLGAAGLGYERELNPEAFAAHAGSDESGKGDYFGPLVVCCAYTDERLSDEMQKLGVKDCKQMSDKQVLTVGMQLRRLLGPTGYAVVKLGPAAYNRLYAKMRNINRMLAWAHGTAIEELLTKRPGCGRVVVDQFAYTEDTIKRALKPLGKKAEVVQMHKAESDIAVAAASVIARELFIRDMLKMGEEEGIRDQGLGTGEKGLGTRDKGLGADAPILSSARKGRGTTWPPLVPSPQSLVPSPSVAMPLGSSDPRVRQLAEEMVRRNGPVWLMNHCKAHFQTTDKVLAAVGKSRADLPPEGQVTSAVANGTFKGRTARTRQARPSPAGD